MEAINRNIQECSRLVNENDINMDASASETNENSRNHIPEDLRQFDVLDEVQGDSASDAENVEGDGKTIHKRCRIYSIITLPYDIYSFDFIK